MQVISLLEFSIEIGDLTHSVSPAYHQKPRNAIMTMTSNRVGRLVAI